MKINQKENENKEENKMKLKSIVFKPDMWRIQAHSLQLQKCGRKETGTDALK